MGWRVEGFDELRELGSGAHGRVVLARAPDGGLRAIKYVTQAAGRLQDEAAVLATVAGPYVARVYAYVPGPGDEAAVVMEAVEGHALKDVLAERGALAPEAALLVLKGSLLGLAAAHGVGVVHRDYKPGNVIVRPDGLSKLVDFGIAVTEGEDAGLAGTPAYMAPEQWTGGPASPATDVYAAACVFFECVTGSRPFDGQALAALRQQHVAAPPPVERLPVRLRELALRGLAKDPAVRQGDAAAFVRELDETAAAAYGRDWEKRGLGVLAGVAAGAGAAGLLAAGGGGAAVAPVAAAASVLSPVAITAGVVAVALVGGAGTAVYVAKKDKKKPPAVEQVAAATPLTFANVSAAASYPVPGRPRLRVTGGVPQAAGGDAARRAAINKLLRGPLDRATASSREFLAGNPDLGTAGPGCEGSKIDVKAATLLSTAKLLAVRYRTAVGLVCNSEYDLSVETVLVDLAAGKEVLPAALFRPGTLPALARRLRWPADPGCVRPTGLNKGDLTQVSRKGGYQPGRVALAVAPGAKGLEVEMALPELGCGKTTTRIAYAKINDLLTPQAQELLKT